MKRTKARQGVIPGFGLPFGIMMSLLGLIVLIHLCVLILFTLQISPYYKYYKTEDRIQLYRQFFHSIDRIPDQCSDGCCAGMGAGTV